jgi:hypothetical protein
MTPPVLVGHVKKRKRIGNASMRAHHIDLPELANAHPDCAAAVLVDRNVTYKRKAPFPEATGSRFQPVSVPIQSYYRRTVIKKTLHDSQANPLRCSSYNNALSAEPRHVRLQGC